jgi:hypothetical protein
LDEGVGEEGEGHLVTGSEYARIHLVLGPIFVSYLSLTVPVEGEELCDSASVLNLAVAGWVEWEFCNGEVDNGSRRQAGHLRRDITSAETSTDDEKGTSRIYWSSVPNGMGSFACG